MYSAHDLEDFGKIASSNLIDKSVSLNEGIQKLAGENMLNRQQINRVVEAANVETYISMMKTAESRYINFDLADAATIADGLGISKTADAVTDDYSGHVVSMHVVETKEETEEEKTASTEEEPETVRPQAELRNEADELKGTVQFLQDAVYEAHASLDEGYMKLGHIVTQHVLSGENFNEAAYVIKQASLDQDNIIADSIKNDLFDSMPLVDFDIEFTPQGLLQTDTPLYKTAQAVGDTLHRIQLTKQAMDTHMDKYLEAVDKTTKVVMINKYAGVISGIGKLVGLFVRNPKATAAAVAAPLVYSAGKRKGKAEQGHALQEVYLKGQSRNPRKAFR
ncbi:hypothetical protein KAR91_67895 [Candidatus Pacearchaeota archaeon]|nr:hypothetical protein [Candidatus Pacearchaeota archaeon]